MYLNVTMNIRLYRIPVRKEREKMNKVVLVGRLTRDPEVRYSTGENGTAVARYTIAVDRRFKKEHEPSADFIPCVVFGRSAEFAEKYFRQGMRVSVSGRIQTGSYTNKEGIKVYTTEVIIEEQEFAESRGESGANRGAFQEATSSPSSSVEAGDGFMNIPDGIDVELPFH
jgi:single-strand DNA-binding protein